MVSGTTLTPTITELMRQAVALFLPDVYRCRWVNEYNGKDQEE